MKPKISRTFAAIFFLAWPMSARADLNNTAQVSYSDTSGNSQTGFSNSVTVIVNGNGAPVLPAPDLSDLNGKTFTPQDMLAVRYSAAATGFNWEFDSLNTPEPMAVSEFGSRAAGQALVPTAAPSLGLSALGLAFGPYLLRVQAVNGGQTSAWASASISLASVNLSSTRVYPNPWRSDKHPIPKITFDGLTGNADIKIFSISGRLVKDLGKNNGQAQWNLTNDAGDRVAAGIYIYFITDDQGNKIRGKLALVR